MESPGGTHTHTHVTRDGFSWGSESKEAQEADAFSPHALVKEMSGNSTRRIRENGYGVSLLSGLNFTSFLPGSLTAIPPQHCRRGWIFPDNRPRGEAEEVATGVIGETGPSSQPPKLHFPLTPV